MRREFFRWYSPALFRDMNIVVYGHYGTPLLMFPTATADFLEYERFHLIGSIQPIIDSGKFKVICIDGVNQEMWLNNSMIPSHKSIRHGQYNQYVTEEVVPFIYDNCGSRVPIITSGASVGAYHAANSFFRRPDIFRGTVAMSGIYDLKYYSKGHYDNTVYFNSPVDYLPNNNDENYLNMMRHNLGIIFASGQGNFEDPGASIHISNILNSKGIRHFLDLWGHDMTHDWPTWRKMLPYFLGEIF